MDRPRAWRSAAGCLHDLVGLGQSSVDHLWRVKEHPAPGSKVHALDYHLLPGGQVATAVLAARRHGLRACFVGAVGDDELGRQACSLLEGEGVRLELRRVSGAATQLAAVIVDQTGERTIIERHDPRTVVRVQDLQRELFASTRALHLDITDVPAAIQAARWVREAGGLVSLDIDRLLPGAEELLGLVDLLVASEGLPSLLGAAGPGEGLAALQRLCPGQVCITLGPRGCVALVNGRALHVPAFAVEATDTTGCGDVFRGALIHALLREQPVERALRYASAAAALQATKLGAQSAVPRAEEVERFLAGGPPVRE